MSQHTFLFEIGLEEVPAQYVRDAVNQLESLVSAFLKENRLAFETVETLATPRRLTVRVNGIAEKQEDFSEVAKGPAKRIAQDQDGNWTKAAQGFARGKGASVEDIYFEEVKGEEYVFINISNPGKDALEVLPEIASVIEQMSFPVSMHWGANDVKYIRPIHWLVALLDETLVPVSFLNIQSDRISRGHRYLGSQAVTITSASSYEDDLAKEFVVVNQDTRKKMIEDQIATLATENNYQIDIDQDLLEEVTQIVEYPTAFIGDFDEKYLALPDEVLITSMKNHQRYFYIKDQDGKLLPLFLSVRNGNGEYLDNVRKGNQKVLTARLEDGFFFVNEDKTKSIEDFTARLAKVTFHAEIGSLAEKMARTGQIATYLEEKWSSQLTNIEVTDIERTAEIYKFDLMTGIVDEFSELQGIMGEKYALEAGETPAVATAIREHYMPISADGELPTSPLGKLFAIADKLDAVISFFNIDRIPSGSNDPFALRRQTSGIVRILIENELTLDWKTDIINILQSVYGIEDQDSLAKLQTALNQFVNDRLKPIFNDNGIRYDIADAVLNANSYDVLTKVQASQVLQNARSKDNFKATIEAWNRILNLGEKARELNVADVAIDEAIFETDSEATLYEAAKGLEMTNDLQSNYNQLEALTPAITAFFDNNMIFADDEKVRNNRLAILSLIAQPILTIADTNRINTK
ncbi:glycine--tRNA ligase subunit beta [Aerococcus sp. 1KP-2016]|uniref:glycine--tRNA ligase subunit beta n=1 Tax=Aerococcus sp. 1KP-2016 TaxID=1981982 RepID=UPI000B98F09F|nr:glycine--tRNA ligase subunit beta [Aerococcus sp. 1KP-2016]OYQ66757.1 glycine--tRNA ligase subunit beta [Aerococcus sp. 1KP-2016]